MTLIECGKDIIVVDCGMAFPDEDMPGVDYVIPDVQYLIKNKDRVAAIFLTHGHEDHIGALPYVLRDVNVPVYGTRMTLGIVVNKLREFHLEKQVKLMQVSAGDSVKIGSLSVEYIHTNHSIADSAALAIHTPCGVIFHTGDFKIDVSPIDGDIIDLPRIGELGKEGILALLSDSTGAEKPGHSMSESKVGSSLNDIFRRADKKRIIVATFASNVHRVQQIINLAAQYGRRVAVSGRSMMTVLEAAMQLGYTKVPKGVLIDIDKIKKIPPEQLVVITTGSQGEPMSALYRMAYSEHKVVEINEKDLVIVSASAIPGNEKPVGNMVNELFRSGAEVVYESYNDIHASGHACQEELKLMLGMTQPKFFIPVHGEYRHLHRHAKLAESMGIAKENILISEIGNIIELDKNSAKIVGTVPAGRVLVDGLGVGDVGNVVLRDRKHLAQDGLIVAVAVVDTKTGELISEPEIVTRGFVYIRENEELMNTVKTITSDVITRWAKSKQNDWAYQAKIKLRDELDKYIYGETMRKPMILPVIKYI
ncbi:MAG: ribonuclease J [Clostridia bacterium]|nr:ribonuclease J [Clostridia bacterium]MBQ5743374.1 ribonuclease J [Clostridia bacterium]